MTGLYKFLLALATLVGTIIGVGMFGLPYAAAQAGLGVTLAYLVVLALAVTTIHLVYGEIVLRSAAKHRLAGYAQMYLGSWGKLAGSVIFFVTLYLALLAYILVGGEFLSVFLNGWWNISSAEGGLLVAAFGFLVVFRGIKTAGALELAMSAVLTVLILGLAGYSFRFIEPNNWSFLNATGNIFLPYGIILFALAGGSAIPEISVFLRNGRARLLKRVIIIGTVVPAIIYGIFMLAVSGVSGLKTSPEALAGLVPFLGSSVIRYGALVGLLAVITSFFTLGLNIQNSFRLDFGFSKLSSSFLTAAVPLILFFYGQRDFIGLLSFGGAVLGGLEGLLLLAIWTKARKHGDREPEYKLKLQPIMVCLLALMFLAGVIYQFVY